MMRFISASAAFSGIHAASECGVSKLPFGSRSGGAQRFTAPGDSLLCWQMNRSRQRASTARVLPLKLN